jgi:hypothetical protein
MKALAAKSVNQTTETANSARQPAITPLHQLPDATVVLQRKPSCACGGGCPRCGDDDEVKVQAKLPVSTPGDMYEAEADRVAEQVISMPIPAQRAIAPEGSLKSVVTQRKTKEHAAVTAVRSDFLNTLGAGRSLEQNTRSFFEKRFGHDFKEVRVHTDSAAANSARAINARAYTAGTDLVFGAGEYAPETAAGRKLIAHELTHVLQQRGAGKSIQRESIEDCTRPEADYVTEAVTRAWNDIRELLPLIDRRPLRESVSNALWLAFRDETESTATAVANRLRTIKDSIIHGQFICRRRPHPDYLRSCNEESYGFVSWVEEGGRSTPLNPIFLCMPQFSDLNYYEQSRAVIHEAAHRYLNRQDTGYFTSPDCLETGPQRRGVQPNDPHSGTRGDSPALRLNNADAYACFVHFLRYTPRSEMGARAESYRGTNLTIEARGGTYVYTQTGSAAEPSFRITPAPDDAGFRFRWRLEANGRVYRLAHRSSTDPSDFNTQTTEVYVPQETRAALARDHVRAATIICEVQLYAGGPEAIVTRRIEVTVLDEPDPFDPTRI